MPHRVQRTRRRGGGMPPGAKYVGRPTQWGNPYKGPHAVDRYRELLNERRTHEPMAFRRWLEPLRKHALACWCPLETACHVEVLLFHLKELFPEDFIEVKK